VSETWTIHLCTDCHNTRYADSNTGRVEVSLDLCNALAIFDDAYPGCSRDERCSIACRGGERTWLPTEGGYRGSVGWVEVEFC
jgi:hypothetical protein